jgi:hypothetical protein
MCLREAIFSRLFVSDCANRRDQSAFVPENEGATEGEDFLPQFAHN